MREIITSRFAEPSFGGLFPLPIASSSVEQNVIDIATDFTRFPAGRYRTDGIYSGERFRDDLLVPALRKGTPVVLKLDGTLGYGSSFLEEVFGGLARAGEFTPEQLNSMLVLETADRSLKDEIREYLTAARH